jgi:hypothetical protein
LATVDDRRRMALGFAMGAEWEGSYEE